MRSVNTLTITQPDDWHLHLRDGLFLQRTVSDSSIAFKRALVMPNLPEPITTLERAKAYRERILAARPKHSSFEPCMSLYLTDDTTPHMLKDAKDSGLVLACKLYPAKSTTNSRLGVQKLEALDPLFEVMSKLNLLLLVHAEVTDPEVDVFDREAVFIERFLAPLRKRFPSLKIVLEHVTTQEGVDFVKAAGPHTAATITAHHLLLNRNDLLAGALRPHHYCLPILKALQHQRALVAAATSGLTCFFLGTDSAPHAQKQKECASGCAGIYTAPYALSYYAAAFEAAQALDKLEAFASFYGADFYGLARNTSTCTLIRRTCAIPHTLQYGPESLVPLFAGQTLEWELSLA